MKAKNRFKKNSFASSKISQRGISMIELILSLIVFSVVSVYLLKQQVQVQEDVKAKQLAESMQDFSDVASNYLLSNSAGLVKAMTDGTGANQYCVVNANPSTGSGTVATNTAKHTCAVDVSFLKYKKVVPMSYSEVNSNKQKWTAIYRLVYADFDNNAGTPDTTDGSVEMLVVGATNGGKEQPGNISQTTTASNITGYSGGYIPNGTWGGCTYDGTKKQACGATGGWNVNLSDFVDNP